MDPKIERALDLRASLSPERKRTRFDASLLRALNGSASSKVKRRLLVLCYAVGEDDLLEAAASYAREARLGPGELSKIMLEAEPCRRGIGAARRLKGERKAIDELLWRAISNRNDREAQFVLDWVEVGDLVAVVQTHADQRIRLEALRRLGKRGPHELLNAQRALARVD
jgi:hypothetical protein